jgi:uncharacterized Zn-binding protein involved in type VI secretion
MNALARVGDRISGGLHCHGHNHGPQPSPGRIVSGASKVFVEGKLAARSGDLGHSPRCCGGIGRIELKPTPRKLRIEGKGVALVGDRTLHCGMGPGSIATGSGKVFCH